MSSCTLSGSDAASFESWFSSVHKAQQRAAAPVVVTPVVVAPTPAPVPVPVVVPVVTSTPVPVPVPVPTPAPAAEEKKKDKKDKKKNKGEKGDAAPVETQEPVTAQEPFLVPEQEPVPVMGQVDGLKAMLQAQFGPMAEAMLLGLKAMPEDQAAAVIASVVKTAMDNLPAIAGKAAAAALHRGQAGAQTAMFAELGNLFGGVTLPEAPVVTTPEAVQPEQQHVTTAVAVAPVPEVPVDTASEAVQQEPQSAVKPVVDMATFTDKVKEAHTFHKEAVKRLKLSVGKTAGQELLSRKKRAEVVDELSGFISVSELHALGIAPDLVRETMALGFMQSDDAHQELVSAFNAAVGAFKFFCTADQAVVFKEQGAHLFGVVGSIAVAAKKLDCSDLIVDAVYDYFKAIISRPEVVAEGEVVAPQQEEIPVEMKDLVVAAKAVNTRA